MRETIDDATLIAYVLDEMDARSRRAVERAARKDDAVNRRLAHYREIIGAARSDRLEARGAPGHVLAQLVAAQKDRIREPVRPWLEPFLRLAPVAVGAIALAVILGSGVSVMGDALEPLPVGSTGSAPSDALLVASRRVAEPRRPVVDGRALGVTNAGLVEWDTLVIGSTAGDTGSTDSL